MQVSLDLGGISEFRRKLEAMRVLAGHRLAKRAAKAGAEPIRDAVREEAPKDTRQLEKAIGVEVTVEDTDTATAVVTIKSGFAHTRRGRRADPREYGVYQEEGTRYLEAKRYMRRGVNRARLAALARVRDVLAAGIEEAAR